MILSELISVTRNVIEDEVTTMGGELVDDATLIMYLNEAEQEAAIRGQLLFDSSTTDITQVSVMAGVASYSLDPRVLVVDRAILSTGTRPLMQYSMDDMDATLPNWEATTGIPAVYIMDVGNKRLRLFPIPEETVEMIPEETPEDPEVEIPAPEVGPVYTLKLSVFRKPLVNMVARNDRPEIDDEHHLPLVDWVAYRIFKSNQELLNPGRAQDHYVAFNDYFGSRPSVRDLMAQRRTQVDQSVRMRPFV